MSQTRAQDTWRSAGFWSNNDRPTEDEHVLWIGAGTRDTGLSPTRLSYQITYATASDTNAERDYIIAELAKGKSIGVVETYRDGEL
ncbi:hypothetical protein ACVIJ6_005294 [Bradyrhizobium sp. USDA 4369]